LARLGIGKRVVLRERFVIERIEWRILQRR
jgi:hypothetical protein